MISKSVKKVLNFIMNLYSYLSVLQVAVHALQHL